MGAPVYDETTKTYVGMFDARDILSCVTAAHREFLSMGGHHNPGEDTAMPHDVELHHKTQRELMAKALPHLALTLTLHISRQLEIYSRDEINSVPAVQESPWKRPQTFFGC